MSAPRADSAAPAADSAAPAADSVAPAADSVAPAADSGAPAVDSAAPGSTPDPAPGAGPATAWRRLSPRLVALAAAALAAACAFAAHAGLPFEPHGPDAQLWVSAVEAARAGDWVAEATTGRPRGYVLLCAVLAPWVGGTVPAMGLVSIAAWVATVGIVAAVVGRAAGPLAGGGAAWVYACSIPPLGAAWYTNSQSLFVAVLAAHLAVGRRLVQAQTIGSAMMLGALAGVGALVKEPGVFVIAADVAVLLALRVRARALAPATLVAFLVACSAPLLADRAWFGMAAGIDGTLAGKVGEPLGELRAVLESADWREARLHGGAWPGVVAVGAQTGPGITGYLHASAIVCAQRLGTQGPLLVLAGLGGLALLVSRDRRARDAAWALVHLAPLAGALAMPIYNAYHLSFTSVPIVVVIGIALGVGLERLAQGGTRSPRAILALGAGVAGAGLLGLIAAPFAGAPWRAAAQSLAIATEMDAAPVHAWLASQPEARVGTTSPAIARVSATLPTPLEYTPNHLVADTLGRHGIWIVDDYRARAAFDLLTSGRGIASKQGTWRLVWTSPPTESGRRIVAARRN